MVWPNQARAAVSLSYDGALPEHLDVVIPSLGKRGLRATFFASPQRVLENVDGWKNAHMEGHEIANGSLLGVADNGRLPNWTLRMVEQDLHMTQEFLGDLTGEEPSAFAFPGIEPLCAGGNYRPVVEDRFQVARSFEIGTNFVDANLLYLNQLNPPAWSAEDFSTWRSDFLESLNSENSTATWTILRFGKMFDGESNHQIIFHELICSLLAAEADRLWVGPVSDIASIVSQRSRQTIQ